MTGQDMCEVGRLGGRANKGKTTTREKCTAAGRAFWENLSSAERSELARERAVKAWKTRRRKQADEKALKKSLQAFGNQKAKK